MKGLHGFWQYGYVTDMLDTAPVDLRYHEIMEILFTLAETLSKKLDSFMDGVSPCESSSFARNNNVFI
jgi:hypothetical protein